MASGLLAIGLKAADLVANQLIANQQYERQKELMDVQLKNQSVLNQQGQKLALDTWEKTNYPAQVAMMKKAGLNPALMYGSAGSGGTTHAGSGGSAAGGNASQAYPMEISSLMSMRATEANIKLMEAEANKTNKEANVIGTTGVEEAYARIKNLGAMAGNAEADTALKNAETAFKKIQTEYMEKSMDESINAIVLNNKELANRIRIGAAQANISEATVNESITQLRLTTVKQGLEIALLKEGILKTQSEIDLNRAQIEQWSQEISQGWERLNQGQQQIEIQKNLQAFNTSLPAKIGQWTGIIGNILKGSASISTSSVNVSK